MRVYFISGLGADETAFRGVFLPGVEKIHLNWLQPAPKETIGEYAARMAARITDPEPVIVGLSFGGIMAVEIAKRIPVRKLILLSSAKTKQELPPYFRLARFIPLRKLLPLQAIARNRWILKFFFGARSAEQQEGLLKIINDTIPGFNEWAIDQLVCWQNMVIPENIYHIHGGADYLLPLRYVKPDHVIKKAGHLMVINNAKEVSILLRELIPLR